MVGNMMERSKTQSHYRYFPGALYLHRGVYARVRNWRADPVTGIDRELVLEKIRTNSKQFGSMDVFPKDASNIELLELRSVRSEVFPKAFRCVVCGRISLITDKKIRENEFEKMARRCREEGHQFKPKQFRFVTIDNCGFVGEAIDLFRDRCKTHPDAFLKLNTHNSERLSNFRLFCEVPGCSTVKNVKAIDHECEWPVSKRKNSVSNSGRTRVSGSSVELLTKNVVSLPEIFTSVNLQDPRRGLIKEIPNWRIGVYKVFSEAESPILSERLVEEIRRKSLSMEQVKGILDDYRSNNSETVKRIEELMEGVVQNGEEKESKLSDASVERILDFLLAANQPPYGFAHSLFEMVKNTDTAETMENLGIRDLISLDEINLTSVLYGYSRGDYVRENRMLKRFVDNYVPDYRSKERTQVYCSPKYTEGVIAMLDPVKVLRYAKDLLQLKWTEEKTYKDAYATISRSFSEREQSINFGKIRGPPVLTDKVYGVVHTISHLFIKAISRMSGVDETSLAELIFPEAASFLIYVNQGEDFNLGTVSTNIKLNSKKLLNLVSKFGYDCMYDPICTQDSNGSCPACLQIGEISCEHFNRELSRKYLTGDGDSVGFWQ